MTGVDFERAVCDNCGRDEHSADELAVCVDSMIGPGLTESPPSAR